MTKDCKLTYEEIVYEGSQSASNLHTLAKPDETCDLIFPQQVLKTPTDIQSRESNTETR